MISIIRTKDRWHQIVQSMDNYDFYHTYDYHQISKKIDETAILLVYEENEYTVAIPFLKSPIEDTKYFDFNSVYGYAGPITKNVDDNFNSLKFKKELSDFLKKENVVSIFSRLNPFIENQDLILAGIGEIPKISKVVYVDVKKTPEEQRMKFQRRTKTHINKARRNCRIYKVESKENIQKFVEIYYENMDRIDAKKRYYFTLEYFLEFMACDDFETTYYLIEHTATKEIIGGGMLIFTNKIGQYHLSGAKNDYLHLSPTKLLIDEMRLDATKENLAYFNLGGGYLAQDDSLLRFKSLFSKDFKNFRVWKYVVNEKVYDQLCETNKNLKAKEVVDFFPEYRFER